MNEPVHVTEIKKFLTCRLSWFWSAPHPRGLGLERKRPAPALHLGSLVHAALDEHYDRGTSAAVALARLAQEDKAKHPEQRDELIENAAMGAGMVRGYEHWAQQSAQQPFRVLATETAWELPLVGRIKIAGRYDLIAERDDGLWVVDFKTTTKTNIDWTQQDLQASVYVWAARRLYGPDVRGMLFRFLRKRLPDTYGDLVLKSGKLTRRKSLPSTTTYEEYSRALAIVALNEVTALTLDECKTAVLTGHSVLTSEEFKDEYADLRRIYWDTLQELRGIPNPFFWDVQEYRTDEQLQRYMQYVVVPAAREMVSKRKGRWIGPTGLGAAHSNCSWCTFRNVCQAWADGADFRAILDEEYRIRER